MTKVKSLFNPTPIPAYDPNKYPNLVESNPCNRPIHIGEIHTTDREPQKMTVSELIYILEKLEGDRDVKVHIRHKGLDCSWERDLLMVFQNDGDEFVSLCVDI